MGGLIAAATTKPSRALSLLEPPTAVIGRQAAEPRYSVAKQYWLSLLVVCLVSATLYVGIEHRGLGTMEGLLVFALVLPMLQLGASVLVLVTLLATRRRRPGHAERMSHLGRITLRAFIGGLIGIGLMIVIGIAL